MKYPKKNPNWRMGHALINGVGGPGGGLSLSFMDANA